MFCPLNFSVNKLNSDFVNYENKLARIHAFGFELKLKDRNVVFLVCVITTEALTTGKTRLWELEL